ncbi:penicillin-binding transpeptidase domain-containing protein [Serpentinicella sp. ANB-PHB4]|uniref:peptidoglycan D,D-transpeptidase FtsI family protein n=1 Tax=Serpentinicella sp. ANB-PHB4 TaxID=3074076 RepID=UPI0028551F62|nr:penicillin-binding transpeptidase domain-containing protein [Serpentinicella sp. ANB-PHB4]MDR5659726.1 penicillin-binding transpeptidase domain-containing protein [Serpentinicella sp. ANB-PHB4]
MRANHNKKIIHLIILSSCLFLSIIVYMTYFQIAVSQEIVSNPYNRRQWIREDNTMRGRIFDRNTILLADTEVIGGVPTRIYPHNNLYSHVIGYNSKQYGRTRLESHFNDTLMGLTDSPVSRIREQITGDMIQGNDLILTIDHELQSTAERLLRWKRGSIVALQPNTGEVLAMVSKPDFNPNTLRENWDDLTSDIEGRPLVNRSLQDLYPPASTFKMVIAAAVLENLDQIEPEYSCEGSIEIEGHQIKDYNLDGHGPVDLTQSVAVSCNTNFVRMAHELGPRKVLDISHRFFLGRSINTDMVAIQSRIPEGREMTTSELMEAAIGQGKVEMTPMHMALVASTIANNGILIEPRFVREVHSPGGRVIDRLSTESYRVIAEDTAEALKAMMVTAVDQGTGRAAGIPGVNVGGKTGTAQVGGRDNHAMFIAFAPEENPQIAVAVVLENEGRTGGAAAAPMAREMINAALRKGGN